MYLDLSNIEVCNYLVEKISNILENVEISYVKWDMNRNMTEITYGVYLISIF